MEKEKLINHYQAIALIEDRAAKLKVIDDLAELEIIERYERLSKVNQSVKLQALTMEACRYSVADWINDWCWTLDPRLELKMRPFLLFPKQLEYLQWRERLRSHSLNGLVEKSRDSGMSWINAAHHLHCWLFEENFAGAFGSNKEEQVDQKGNPKTLFEKIRILLRYLPVWMRPSEFDWRQHDNFRRLINPSNGSTISGECGDDMGRGGRSSMYDWDEVAFTEHASAKEAALSGNTNVLFYTSTVQGHNFFYTKRSHLSKSNPDWVFCFHWSQDPRKDIHWYREQTEKFDPVTVASEIDLNYGASVEGIYIIYDWVMAAVDLELPPSRSKQPRIAAMDVAGMGKNLSVFGVREGNRVIHIQHWDKMTPTDSAYFAAELCEQWGVSLFVFDSDGEVGGELAGTLNAMSHLSFQYIPLHGGAAASDIWWESEQKTAKDKFFNARAEWWGQVWFYCKNAYDYKNGIRDDFTASDLISIPNHPTLIQQISQPKRFFTPSRKIKIESKQEMRDRGLESPDHADMLAYLFAPVDIGMWGNL